MDFIIDAIVEWLKGLLVDGIMGNLDGLFDNVNQSVGEIATQVGTTPADWNAGVFSMIRQISETAILPIAGVILTFVMTYELIQMLIERNNLHEVDTWMFFKWVFKTFVAVMILTNTFNIVLAVFDVSQHVIQQSAGIIQNGTEITPDVLDSLRTELEAMELGPLFGLWLQSFLIQLTMIALNIVIFVIVYDNAVAESFFASLKKEELYRRNITSDRAFQASVASYIEFYNTKRPHRTLKNLTPCQMEESCCATAK